MAILTDIGQFRPFEILWEDAHLLAIQKPSGIMVHRTGISEDTVFILQELRDQLGYQITPVHRLDRGTSGVLLFAKTTEAMQAVSSQFEQRSVEKVYWAVVRGHCNEQGDIDYPLSDVDTGKKDQEALSQYKTLAKTEMPYAIGNKYTTARFSFVEVYPKTGRRHQIRKHMAHILHPIIGDKKHGDNKHNAYFEQELTMSRMLLHGRSLAFTHPISGARIFIEAPLTPDFIHGLTQCGFSAP
jgi:tRNA pseudouridine65 synthase